MKKIFAALLLSFSLLVLTACGSSLQDGTYVHTFEDGINSVLVVTGEQVEMSFRDGNVTFSGQVKGGEINALVTSSRVEHYEQGKEYKFSYEVNGNDIDMYFGGSPFTFSRQE